MKEGKALEVRPLTDKLLGEVVRIHLSGMGYTLNSRLGPDHLRYLYQTMSGDPGCYVGVALAGDRPAGVVSGSIDAGRLTSRILRGMAGRRLVRTAAAMLLQPYLMWLWWQGTQIGAPVRVHSKEVRAVLTAIVVDPAIQSAGVGRALLNAFESFLRQRRVHRYRLDTQIANERAGGFYRELGFEEAARRAGSIVFVRQLSQ
jgi:ribosomal protein S18 acetylase RimI-like enzyme